MREQFFFKTEDDLVKFILDRVRNITSVRLHKMMYILHNQYAYCLSGDVTLPKELVDIEYREGKQGIFVPTIVEKWREGKYEESKIRGYVSAKTGFEQRVYKELGDVIEEFNEVSDISLISLVKENTKWKEEDVGKTVMIEDNKMVKK